MDTGMLVAFLMLFTLLAVLVFAWVNKRQTKKELHKEHIHPTQMTRPGETNPNHR
ncbi:MAG: hypothetical protein ACK4GT_12595 [Pararhodobacter sp.]